MDQEKQEVWLKHWILAFHCNQFDYAGDIETFSIMDDEFIIVFTDVGFKAFRNACPHRGARLIQKKCSQQRTIVCPLCRWTFSLEGKAIGIPPPQPEYSVRLSEVHCEVRLGFIWISVAPKPVPIDSFLKETMDWFENYDLENLNCHGVVNCTVQANWKTSCDLQNEVYHLQSLHPNILGLVNDTGTKFTLGKLHAHIHIPMFERSQRKLTDVAIRRAAKVYRTMGVSHDVNKATLSLQIAMKEKRPLTLPQLTDIQIVYIFPNVQIKMRQNEILVFRHLPDPIDPNRFIFTEYKLYVEPLKKPLHEETVSLHDKKMGHDGTIDLRAIEHQQKGLRGNQNGQMRLAKQDILVVHLHKQLTKLGIED